MSFQSFMNKVRQIDNRSAQWISKHFYLLFFEIVLVIIFLVFFVNVIKSIDLSVDVAKGNLQERMLFNQDVFVALIVILLLFNSFWMLYIFNSILRLRGILRNIDYNLTRRGDKREEND